MVHPQFLNDPKTFVTDAIRGLAASTDDLVWQPDPGYLTRRSPLADGQVAVLSGGGSGHEPMHAGFIGRGMLTGACPGLVFTSPNALQVEAATRAVDAGGGVVHIVKNYTGDVLNFRIAADLAHEDGIDVDHVLVDDDVASDRGDESGPGRRGTAATIAVEKICGASAERGDDMATVASYGRRVAENARSMAVALRPPTLPGAAEPSFDLPEDQIEIGIGIHGERGTDRADAMPARELVPKLAGRIVESLALRRGEQVIAIVNGLGATHPLELQVLFGELSEYLEGEGVVIARPLVGSFVTALDMAGASITLVRCDDGILELWDAPTEAPAWPNAPATSSHRVDRTTGDAKTGKATETSGREIADAPGRLGQRAVGTWLGSWIERVRDQEPELTKMDRQAGDGDFGTNMLAALDYVDLDAVRENYSPAATFAAVSDAYLGRAGGTSGALFGVWFRQFYRAAADAEPKGLGLADLAQAARTGLDTITDLGGAQPGDKTMVDSLDPAARALEAAVESGDDLTTALAAAADAAKRGAESTAEITASRGRASYIGEAARGVTDPGSLVMAWLFEEAAGAV